MSTALASTLTATLPATLSATAAFAWFAGFAWNCFELGQFLWKRDALNRLTSESLDVLQESALILIAERDRDARCTCARRATDAVHVCLGLHGEIEVEDVRDGIDVESACSNIRCNEHSCLAFTECFERARALILRLITVNCIGFDLRASKFFHHAICAVLRLREDECALDALCLENVYEQRNLQRLGDAVDCLRDTLDGC